MSKKFLPKTYTFFIIYIIIIVVVLWIFFTHGDPGQLRVHLMDVGYGDAIFVEFPDKTNVLVDAGEKMFSAKVAQYLQSLNVEKIDRAIITHPHKNHFEGFEAVLREIPVESVYVNGDPNAEDGYAELLQTMRQKQIPIQVLRRGQRLEHLPQGCKIEIIHPEDLKAAPNGNAIVIWLEFKDTAVLLTSDIGPKQQDELIVIYDQKFKEADLVQIPHHGGPLSDRFIEHFVNKIFVVSTGKNRWGLPEEEQLQRLRGKIYRTDQTGDMVFVSDGVSIEASDEK